MKIYSVLALHILETGTQSAKMRWLCVCSKHKSYAIKFTKPKCKTFKRHIWNYEWGNYDLLRSTALLVDWDSFQGNNVDIYSENITSTILSIAKECIPNRQITIRPSEPPWITTEIKRNIRKRKRAYQKAKSTVSKGNLSDVYFTTLQLVLVR